MLKVIKNSTRTKVLNSIFTIFLSTLIMGQVSAKDYDKQTSYEQQSSRHGNGHKHKRRSLRFDIAENGARFSFDAEPVDENGLPAYGGEFITQGYLYPHGFLDSNEGVMADGSPTYPNEVLGRWICRGWHIGEGATTVTGPWVVTTQIFDLKEKFGKRTIITEGYELADINEPIDRAITGGTGKYKQAKGSSTQKLLGFNASLGVNVRVVLHPRR